MEKSIYRCVYIYFNSETIDSEAWPPKCFNPLTLRFLSKGRREGEGSGVIIVKLVQCVFVSRFGCVDVCLGV